ncbi:PF15 protein [Gonium pectorale]|uniref:PF15 protein n=1 Tax=Gonium pectorale TaxID=33097 RepID=A0A150H4K2_GONPE|nr:PF15 protein [Gonium pectorale]|eukprot:KXZ56510.1 PF15 protein [Gonium pectorale]
MSGTRHRKLVTKSLSGHKSNVTCLSWHPYDSTVVSGSMDTNVKLWSLKDSKDAITTFKGHGAGVTHVRYSPDGHWVASASSDGSIKIWDIRAGKLQADLCPPSKYEITGLEFSPTEYLLATSSRDKVVRLWDVETFQNVHQTTPEATPVRNIAFSNDGKYIFSAVQDGCRVWTADPPEQQDYVDVPWFRVCDLLVGEYRGGHRLLGCSFHSSMVGLFEIPLRNVRPFNEDPNYAVREPSGSVDGNPIVASRSNLLGVASAAQLPPAEAMRRVSLNDRGNASAGGSITAYAQGPSGNGSRPGSGGTAEASAGGGVGRSIERAGPSGSVGRLPPAGPQLIAGARQGVTVPRSGMPSGSNRYPDVSPAVSQDIGGVGDSVDYPARSRHSAGQPSNVRPPMVSIGVGVGESLMRGQLQPDDLQRSAAGEPSRSRQQQAQQQPRQRPYNGAWHKDQQLGDDAGLAVGQPSAGSAADPRYPWLGGLGQAGSAAGPTGPDRRAGAGNGYDASSSGGGLGGGVYRASDIPSELDVAASIGRQHQPFMASMKKRAHSLSLIRNFVAKCDWRGAINCARRCDDLAAFADLLEAMHERRDAFSLDLVGEVTSVLELVLSLPADRQLQVGLDVVALHVRAFGPVIRDLCAPAARGVGIDLSFEERRERANRAKQALQSLVPKLKAVSKQSPALAARASDLAGQLAQL